MDMDMDIQNQDQTKKPTYEPCGFVRTWMGGGRDGWVARHPFVGLLPDRQGGRRLVLCLFVLLAALCRWWVGG